MVSTHLKNISQIDHFPRYGWKKYIWNHHLDLGIFLGAAEKYANIEITQSFGHSHAVVKLMLFGALLVFMSDSNEISEALEKPRSKMDSPSTSKVCPDTPPK